MAVPQALSNEPDPTKQAKPEMTAPPLKPRELSSTAGLTRHARQAAVSKYHVLRYFQLGFFLGLDQSILVGEVLHTTKYKMNFEDQILRLKIDDDLYVSYMV